VTRRRQPRPTSTSATTSASPPRRLTRDEQLHHRPDLPSGDRQGAARRIPRQDRAGDPAHHQRDQGDGPTSRRPTRRPTSSSPRSAARWATSRACPSSRPSGRSRSRWAARTCMFVHLTLRALPQGGRRTEDEAHPALGGHPPPDRHPARRPRLPHRRRARCFRPREDRRFCNVPLDYVIGSATRIFRSTRCRSRCNPTRSTNSCSSDSPSRRGRRIFTAWHDILHRLRNPEHEISIALVGKYAEHRDAYKSIYEALDHGGITHKTQVRVQPIKSEDIEREGAEHSSPASTA